MDNHEEKKKDQALKLFEYLKKNADGQHKEFRVVVREDGSSYVHVLGEDSETLDFTTLSSLPENPPPVPPHPGTDAEG